MRTEIIFEDNGLIVCYKPAGLATQTKQIGQKDVDSELKNHLRGGYLAMIHRLDQPVEGLLVFAKTKEAAASLSKQLGNDEMNKTYLAVVYGQLSEKQGTLTNYLFKEAKGNVSRIADAKTPGAKYAELSYEVLAEDNDALKAKQVGTAINETTISLVRVHLKTGRHHQIRLQFAGANHPLLGDNKYAGEEVLELSKNLQIRNVALCASELHFLHPKTKKKMEFKVIPKGLSFQMFRDILDK